MNVEPPLNVVQLIEGHMIDHPAGAHTVVWNGPMVLDVGLPEGGFVRFPVANFTPQWALLADSQGRQLPIAVRRDTYGLAVCWLPYDGPPARSTAIPAGGMSDAQLGAALQKLSATRYEGLMNAAWGIGGWSTYRR